MQSTNQTRRVCIVLFDEVEVLDFCGPFEVFSVTGQRQGMKPFEVYTVAHEAKPIRTRGGTSVTPHYSFANCYQPDILLVPGGMGARRELGNSKMIEWLKERAAECERILSVRSGALLLAKAGLLDGLTATTHYGALDELRALGPNTIRVDDSKRFVDNGRVIVSAGIFSGIDMSLHIVAHLLGEDLALETARYMEYDWRFCADHPPYVRRFAIRMGSRMALVMTDEIDWIEAAGDYATLHVEKRTLLLRETFNSLEKRLDPDKFIRIHRSTIVHASRIRDLQTMPNRELRLRLLDGTELKVSRTYRYRFDRWLSQESPQR